MLQRRAIQTTRHINATRALAVAAMLAVASVAAATPPSSGLIEISPTAGVAYATMFTVQCRNWTDEPADLPLTYQFWYGPGHAALGPAQAADVLAVTLPPGDALDSDKLEVGCDVTNQSLQTTSVSTEPAVRGDNTPPHSGTCEVVPGAGTALSTPFEAACYGWLDSEGDLPLTYSFSYIAPFDGLDPADLVEISFKDDGPANHAIVILPSVAAGPATQTFRLTVSDALGGSTSTDIDVAVDPSLSKADVAAIAGQLKTVAKYESCVGKAEAKAAKKGTLVNANKCDAKLDSSLAKVVAKYPGAATTVDADATKTIVRKTSPLAVVIEQNASSAAVVTVTTTTTTTTL